MSSAPGKKTSFDFLTDLPDTGYRPTQQSSVAAPAVRAEPAPKATETGSSVLMVLLSELVGNNAATAVPELEARSAERGVETVAFYRALATLLESQLVTKDGTGVSPTEAGRKVAAFSAS